MNKKTNKTVFDATSSHTIKYEDFGKSKVHVPKLCTPKKRVIL